MITTNHIIQPGKSEEIEHQYGVPCSYKHHTELKIAAVSFYLALKSQDSKTEMMTNNTFPFSES